MDTLLDCAVRTGKSLKIGLDQEVIAGGLEDGNA
jgi:hypothetical protein